MFLEYLIVFKYVLFALLLSLLLFWLSGFFVFQKPTAEKTSAYECGFNPWSDARSRFEIQYYLVAILFIIFDLEITFLYPWVVSLFNFDTVPFFTMLIFLIIITIGFIYELAKGALSW
jgi:NADH:ubiquinone oxidoreductase subunit 3 (subunit A)